MKIKQIALALSALLILSCLFGCGAQPAQGDAEGGSLFPAEDEAAQQPQQEVESPTVDPAEGVSSESGQPAESEESAEQPTPAASTQFDSRLMGHWACRNVESDMPETREDGRFSIANRVEGSSIVFYHDGTYAGSMFAPESANQKYLPKGQAIIQDNVLEFPGFPDNLYEGLDLTMEYSIEDLPVEEISILNDDKAPLYEADPEDRLVVHVTGTYRKSPTNVQTIDEILYFEKELPLWSSYYYFDYTMLGEWTDDLGNTWIFEEDPAPQADANGELIVFSLKDSEGTVYPGDFFGCNMPIEYDASTQTEIYFHFEDMSLSVSGTMASFDGNTLVIEKDPNYGSGTITLTRVQ